MSNPFKDAENFDRLESLLQDKNACETDQELLDLANLAEALSQHGKHIEVPNPEKFRQDILTQVKKSEGPRHNGLWLLLAAVVVAGFFLFRPDQQAPVLEEDDFQKVVIAPELLDEAMEGGTRDRIVEYLENTENLLLSVRDYSLACSDHEVDISPEKKLAGTLLLQHKLFSEKVKKPEFLQAQTLFDQLENILVDLNSLDPCTDPTEVEFLNKHIIENRILNKIRLVAQELQVS